VQTEPLAVLNKQFDYEIPGELIETIDFVMSAPRQVYLDGSLLLTNAEVWERRERGSR
jgi:hypothetical protein